jgi:hypothetical protein
LDNGVHVYTGKQISASNFPTIDINDLLHLLWGNRIKDNEGRVHRVVLAATPT